MSKVTYSRVLEEMVADLVKKSHAIRDISHSGLKGNYRESLVRKLLSSLLPSTCGVYKGTTASSYEDNRSKTEDDILIVDKECLPPILFSEYDGIFPIESVLARIEVKSKLDNGTFSDAVDGARQYKSLRMNMPGGKDKGNNTFQCLFAFDSERTVETIEGYIASLPLSNKGPEIDCICVPGKGMWFWDHYSNENGHEWHCCK